MLLQKLQKILGEKHTNKNMPASLQQKKAPELNVLEYNFFNTKMLYSSFCPLFSVQFPEPRYYIIIVEKN